MVCSSVLGPGFEKNQRSLRSSLESPAIAVHSVEEVVVPDDNVINAQAWLLDHVDRLLESEGESAIPYLERLLVSSEEPGIRFYCLKNLGLIYLSRGEVDEARKYLRPASEIIPKDADVHFALGQIATQTGNWWLALTEFMEAVYHGREREDLVHFMRSVAATMRQLEFGASALSVLLGAHERKPDDPFVLEALATIYEAEARWLDAIEARDSLVEALESHRALDGDRPMELTVATRERIEQLSRKLRDSFSIVGDANSNLGPSNLSRVNAPSGLHTLVSSLGLRSHNLPLLETAEELWAKALYAKFDVHLSIPTLAAAVHWIVERMHWRIPTPLSDLAQLYGADDDRLPAAVRLLVACLRVELIPTQAAEWALHPDDVQRLQRLQKAILYDVDLDDVEPRAMLGGDDD